MASGRLVKVLLPASSVTVGAEGNQRRVSVDLVEYSPPSASRKRAQLPSILLVSITSTNLVVAVPCLLRIRLWISSLQEQRIFEIKIFPHIYFQVALKLVIGRPGQP
jgi:hypothetical protein